MKYKPPWAEVGETMGGAVQLTFRDIEPLPVTMGIKKNELRAYFKAVHASDSDERGFIVFAQRRGERWIQHGYKYQDFLTHVRKMDNHYDNYMSAQTFLSPFRRIEHLWRLGCFIYDIDCHDSDDPAASALDTYDSLAGDVFGSTLPEPSLVVFTGRGLQLVYLLDPLLPEKTPYWAVVGEAVAKRLREGLPAFSAELDPNYSDVTRVQRMPGTFNTKAFQHSRLLPTPEEPARYRLNDLRDEFLPELILPSCKKVAKNAKTGRVSYLYTTYSLHWARLGDLVLLLEMRQEAEVKEDCRRRMVFLYRYWSCFCVGEDQALVNAQEFNQRFRVPLPVNTVKVETRSAESAFQRWQVDQKKGYNYRNVTLIKLLGISEEEQTRLATIISPEEKKRRQKDKGWYHAKRDEAKAWGNEKRNGKRSSSREEKRTQRDSEVKKLLLESMSYQEIAGRMKISYGTVATIAKRLGLNRGQGSRTHVVLRK